MASRADAILVRASVIRGAASPEIFSFSGRGGTIRLFITTWRWPEKFKASAELEDMRTGADLDARLRDA
ncbi:MAG: hypothetical protein ABW048_11290, partial [Sphingobium sp.]